MAMPPPMVPPPITTSLPTGSTCVSAGRPGTRCASRSPKKMCRSALDCSPATRLANKSRSFCKPSSKGMVKEARTASTQPFGLSCPRARFNKAPAAASNAAISWPAILSVRLRARVKFRPRLARAKAMAPASKSPSITASIKPSFSASVAFTGSPGTMIFSAASGPISRGRRCVPPAPGTKPRFTSGRPRFASASATRAWQASATSKPPPKAEP